MTGPFKHKKGWGNEMLPKLIIYRDTVLSLQAPTVCPPVYVSSILHIWQLKNSWGKIYLVSADDYSIFAFDLPSITPAAYLRLFFSPS